MKTNKSEIKLLAKNHADRRSRRMMAKIIAGEKDANVSSQMLGVYRSLQPKQPNGRAYPSRGQRRAQIRMQRLPGNKPGRIAFEEREQKRRIKKERDERDNVTSVTPSVESPAA